MVFKLIKMKNSKLLGAFILTLGLFLTSFTIVNAAGCTQKHIDCPYGPGLILVCKGPATSTTCYTGGCDAPVTIATCDDSVEGI